MSNLNHEEVITLKNIETHAATVQAWYNTTLELDKSILGLSAGGIGLLITLQTTKGITSFWMFLAFAFASLFLIVALVCVLRIFSLNAEYLQKLTAGGDLSLTRKLVRRWDRGKLFAFILGVVSCALFGVSSAFNTYEEALNNKVKAKQPSESPNQLPINRAPEFGKSFLDKAIWDDLDEQQNYLPVRFGYLSAIHSCHEVHKECMKNKTDNLTPPNLGEKVLTKSFFGAEGLVLPVAQPSPPPAPVQSPPSQQNPTATPASQNPPASE